MLSLIISVYNNVSALELILTALSIQKYTNFEVLIADDGSGSNMRRFIEDFSRHSPFKVVHVHQDDIGFRKNRILNEAIRESNSKYLVFIDGDCVPHGEFTYHHFHNKHANTVLCGRRVNLSKKLSEQINKKNISGGQFEKARFNHIYDSLKPDKQSRSTWVEEGLLIKNKVIRTLYLNSDPHIVGCNFSLHKETIEKINGFDENYEGPGYGEDSDIEFRLRLAGARFKTLRNLAILYHLYHPAAKRSEKNHQYFEKVRREARIICTNGLRKVF